MQTPRVKALDASDIVVESRNVTADEVAAMSAVIVSAAARQRPSTARGGERTGWDVGRRMQPRLPEPGEGQWKRSFLRW